jgi:hypothetical protein
MGRQLQRKHRYTCPMHFDAHQPVLDELEARITAIRDSL